MCRNFIKLIVTLRIVTLWLLLFCLCMLCACDRGMSFPFTPVNFVWSERPKDPLDMYVNSYYSKDEKHCWVVLRCKGSGQVGYADWLVLLCLKENERGNLTVYQLQHGLALMTSYLETDPSIARLRLLKRACFESEQRAGRMVLSYKGEVYGKSNFDDGTDKSWLRFKVKPQRNRKKVASIIKALYPLLEKEKHAPDVVECLSSLLDKDNF